MRSSDVTLLPPVSSDLASRGFEEDEEPITLRSFDEGESRPPGSRASSVPPRRAAPASIDPMFGFVKAR